MVASGADPEQRRMLGGRAQPLLNTTMSTSMTTDMDTGSPVKNRIPARTNRSNVEGLRTRVAAHRVGVEHAEHPGQQKRPARCRSGAKPLDRRHEATARDRTARSSSSWSSARPFHHHPIRPFVPQEAPLVKSAPPERDHFSDAVVKYRRKPFE